MKAIICISGEIASGKSTLARALAEYLHHSAIRSFGDVVRHQALKEGKPLDRATLQAVGVSLIAAGWPSFINSLLEDLPSRVEFLIVEGVRHREAVDEIASRNLSQELLTVYLQVDQHLQSARQQDRGEEFLGHTHAVESSLGEVQAVADVLIDGGLPVREIVDAVIQLL
ncbi:MAG TPA: hypothetical protein VHZ03_04815 [Trebonia sp.]|jgi:gluconate kinase|nr:hypothetical protein [Trebonia sp.]